ncbi:glycosyltransferase [Planctomycetaceae bacterium SH139]
MKPTIVSLGLYQSSGGPSKSISAFQRALGARAVSWLDPADAFRGEQVLENPVIVMAMAGKLNRQILFASREQRQRAEAAIEAASVVSCHSFYRAHNDWVRKTCGKYEVPYWFVPHGSLDPWVLKKGAVLKELYMRVWGKKFLEQATAVVFATRREQEKASPVLAGQKNLVLNWSLDDQDFCVASAEERVQARCSLGLPADAFVLLYFGRLDPMKRPLETVRAFAESKVADAHLLIAGNEYGHTMSEINALAEELGVAGFVHVVGPVYGEARRHVLAASDLYISLSHRENFNFTAAECLASGIPLILSPGNDLGGELVEQPFCTWLTSDDISAAAAKITEIAATGRESLRDLGEEAATWAASHLSFEHFATRLKQFAREISGNEQAV